MIDPTGCYYPVEGALRHASAIVPDPARWPLERFLWTMNDTFTAYMPHFGNPIDPYTQAFLGEGMLRLPFVANWILAAGEYKAIITSGAITQHQALAHLAGKMADATRTLDVVPGFFLGKTAYMNVNRVWQTGSCHVWLHEVGHAFVHRLGLTNETEHPGAKPAWQRLVDKGVLTGIEATNWNEWRAESLARRWWNQAGDADEKAYLDREFATLGFPV